MTRIVVVIIPKKEMTTSLDVISLLSKREVKLFIIVRFGVNLNSL